MIERYKHLYDTDDVAKTQLDQITSTINPGWLDGTLETMSRVTIAGCKLYGKSSEEISDDLLVDELGRLDIDELANSLDEYKEQLNNYLENENFLNDYLIKPGSTFSLNKFFEIATHHFPTDCNVIS